MDFLINLSEFKSVSMPEHLFSQRSGNFLFYLSIDLLIYRFSIILSEFKSVSMSEHLFSQRSENFLFFSLSMDLLIY